MFQHSHIASKLLLQGSIASLPSHGIQWSPSPANCEGRALIVHPKSLLPTGKARGTDMRHAAPTRRAKGANRTSSSVPLPIRNRSGRFIFFCSSSNPCAPTAPRTDDMLKLNTSGTKKCIQRNKPWTPIKVERGKKGYHMAQRHITHHLATTERSVLQQEKRKHRP